MKQKHFIDSHKAVTGLVVLVMIAIYNQWQNPTAWVYLALHGSYGILWVLKSLIFPDRQWEQETGLGYALVIWFALTLYWIAPWILTSRGVQAPLWYLAACVALYALGVFFHFASDMQKHTALDRRPGLITDGFFTLSRNPNYFGELLIYVAFAMLSLHWAPFVVIGLMLTAVWIPNMLKKDRSLSRYPDFEEYRARTRMFIPFIL
jgi:steroid 5-alpha reductase family enzyme